VLWHQPSQCDLLFITLNKSQALFSPCTRTRDLALGPSLFHGESRSGTCAESATGQRTIVSTISPDAGLTPQQRREQPCASPGSPVLHKKLRHLEEGLISAHQPAILTEGMAGHQQVHPPGGVPRRSSP
jgi:hypothetical protein